MPSTAFIWHPSLAQYRFPTGHPLDPVRLTLTLDLIRQLGLLEEGAVVPPRPATDVELQAVHDPAYVAAVGRLSEPDAALGEAERWGIGTEDVPVVEGMDAAARLIAGATLVAAEQVMEGRTVRAFQMSGGLHHAHKARAAGFCVYNDLAVAIAWIRRTYGARVMYIDYDAHHGDGVQELFWDDPQVLTVSFHESGTFLFPGTGWVDEMGGGGGHGYAVNVPLDAHTGDESFHRLFMELVPQLADAFRPDVIVLQNGCDSHFRDPLTHLRCSTGLYERLVRLVGDIADRHCGGRIIATGGGGYAVHDVVPRAWTLVWATLNGETAPDLVPAPWRDAVLAYYGVVAPATLRDPPAMIPSSPREAETQANNLATLRAVRRLVLPLITGWSLGF